MSTILRTIVLLTLSNVFMTFAWYAHLKNLSQKPWIVAALASWGIALFEVDITSDSLRLRSLLAALRGPLALARSRTQFAILSLS